METSHCQNSTAQCLSVFTTLDGLYVFLLQKMTAITAGTAVWLGTLLPSVLAVPVPVVCSLPYVEFSTQSLLPLE